MSQWCTERLEPGSEANTYRVRCRPDDDVTTVLVLTVAGVCDRRPTDLPPLVDAADPDAIERFVDGEFPAEAMLTFPYAGCTITVRSCGEVVVAADRRD